MAKNQPVTNRGEWLKTIKNKIREWAAIINSSWTGHGHPAGRFKTSGHSFNPLRRQRRISIGRKNNVARRGSKTGAARGAAPKAKLGDNF